MPSEHQPPTASPPLPDSHALAAAVEAAAAAAAEASTLANRISTASHRLSKYNNASSPNLKLQAAAGVSVREQARPRSRSFSSTLVPASLPGSPSSLSSPTQSGSGSAPRSSSSSPSGLAASLPQHLQAPRPLLQQPQYSFLPSSSSMATATTGVAAAAAATTTTTAASASASSPPPSLSSSSLSCVVGLGISSQPLPSVEPQWPFSSTPPSSPPALRRQSSFTQLNGAQLPSAHIPAQWRGRFAPDVEKYGGSTPRASKTGGGRSTTTNSSRTSSRTDSPPPGLMSPTLSWTGDELPSQTKERLLRHAASSSLQTLPEGHPLEERTGSSQSQRSRSHSRSSSVSSISDSEASMSTPSRTPAQMYHSHHQQQQQQQQQNGQYQHHHHHHHLHHQNDESDVEEGDDEELRRIIEDAIKIASARAAAARVARESMNGSSPHDMRFQPPPHRHAYQLSDSSEPTVN
ncbi:hypothetical protein DFQ27_007520 [Actinomortierella ambigua]|uniref:Uncharacterized protein n=1 Tax=Actinomortierella ambigua TaxID=1343610 RepID=A0A9P6TZI6_9FUNG|nr:hypothetical protein DFQ27_007520 [Actinomortierella ambigua]